MIYNLKRGNIVLCQNINFNKDVQRKLRPYIVISNDIGNKYSNIFIGIPVTKRLKKEGQPTHCEIAINGNTSMVLCEQITTLSQENIIAFYGFVNQEKMKEIENCVMISLDLKERQVNEMFEVTYSMEGIIRKIMINASDALQAQNIFTNMYGSGKVQIINVRRV